MKYKFLEDLTSDVLFEAYGKTFEELLENVALAMFSVICDINQVKPLKSIKIEITSQDERTLLYDWLNELLLQSEIKGMFLSKFKVQKVEHLKGLHLLAIVFGEDISPDKGRTVVKGVPYYGFELKRAKSGYKAKVALDI